MSLTQLRHQSLICFVVKAVLFLISVVMEMLRCHTTLEVSFCNEEEEEDKKKSSVLQLYCLYILPFNYLFIILKYSDSDDFADEHFRKINVHIFCFCVNRKFRKRLDGIKIIISFFPLFFNFPIDWLLFKKNVFVLAIKR